MCLLLWLYESKFGPSMSCMKKLREQAKGKQEDHIHVVPPSPDVLPTERTPLLRREVSTSGHLTDRHMYRRSRSVVIATKTAMPRRQPALMIKPDFKLHEGGVVSDAEVSYSTIPRRNRQGRYVVP